MKEKDPKIIYLKDYQKPDYLISQTHLIFELDDHHTTVQSKLDIECQNPGSALVLQGEGLQLESIQIEGKSLSSKDYECTEKELTIFRPPLKFILEIKNIIDPVANKALEGLYKSGGIFCTQNEPEGFRRITYYIDRPDVMAKFTTKIIADKKKYPILLSNGNLIDQGNLSEGRHWVLWEDPFKKPCYLYALVAGDLGIVQENHTTMSGRKIDLRLYCDKGNENKCIHAMNSLKSAMKWDEDTYGLEYDLDIYMIVAVDSFNMGAMENKGLNIFNTSCVLARPDMATDNDFLNIEGVVAHEYFHNWTGNRVTCRDWFQLTLKEGLTVFRDQKFSSDMNAKTVQRIDDMERLRTAQFMEDAGPTTHPIKPSSYMQINNFYTATVYEKGAEVIKMIETFLGEEGFRSGMDKYFELYDGQAVTTEDFIHAMETGGGFDFGQFKLWYNQAGTPLLDITGRYDEKKQTYTLHIHQSCPPTKESKVKKPFHLPFAIGLLDENGVDLSLKLENRSAPSLDMGILPIREQREEFVFKVPVKPIISLNRNFSAPVKWQFPYGLEDLSFLMAFDNNGVARYEASQLLAKRVLVQLIEKRQKKENMQLSSSYNEAFGKILTDNKIDPALLARIMLPPTESILQQDQKVLDFVSTHDTRRFVIRNLAKNHQDKLLSIYRKFKDKPYDMNPQTMGERALKNTALFFLMNLENQHSSVIEECFLQFKNADNMTDSLAALSLLADTDCKERETALEIFYNRWKKEPLVVQKWMAIQGRSSLPHTFDQVKKLLSHPLYDKTIPNYVRALLYCYSRNYIHFHREDGLGYAFIADQIIDLDSINPHVSAGLSHAFQQYKRLPEGLKNHVKPQLERIKQKKNLSSNTCEILNKILE